MEKFVKDYLKVRQKFPWHYTADFDCKLRNNARNFFNYSKLFLNNFLNDFCDEKVSDK